MVLFFIENFLMENTILLIDLLQSGAIPVQGIVSFLVIIFDNGNANWTQTAGGEKVSTAQMTALFFSLVTKKYPWSVIRPISSLSTYQQSNTNKASWSSKDFELISVVSFTVVMNAFSILTVPYP
jgi:hypothetical protein